MNYRHSYHAGNFADCFKHALLIALLDSFARKPHPCFVLDTHAGIGRYDLTAPEALKTNEAAAGIGRGWHGFRIVLPRALDPARRHRVAVRREADGAELPGSPIRAS